MRRLAVLLATMGLALFTSAGVAFALTLDCTANRGCVGTDLPDTLNGSSGSDDMDGRQADDDLFGNDGSDWMSGDAYAPTDTSTDGNDNISGGIGNDSMVGYGGADDLSGGDDSDFIDAIENSDNPGEDTVTGGGSNDFIFAIDQTKDTINCGAGRRDRVYYDKNLDTLQKCEVARTTFAEEFFKGTSATVGKVNNSRER